MNDSLKEQLILVENIKNNQCTKSYRTLLSDYDPLIKSLSLSFKMKYRQTPIEIEDIRNVMSYHFHNLVMNYDTERQKSFPAYIKEFLYYRTSTWIKHYITFNHQIMNFSKNDMDNNSFKIDDHYSIDEEILDTRKTPNLSKIESQIIDFIKEDYSIKEISEKLNVNIKTLYAAKNRAIEKIQINFETK